MRNPTPTSELVEAVELADAAQHRDAGERAPPFLRRVVQERLAPEGTPRPIIEVPFERIGMDLVGPLPKSARGHEHILVIVNYATRYPEAVPLRKVTAKAIAQELFLLSSRVGIPAEILTNQGTPFMSRLMADFCRLLRVKQLRTTVYHPQTDGLIERFNQTLKQMLRRVVTEDKRDWDLMLPYVLFGIREVPQALIGFTPFKLLFAAQKTELQHLVSQFSDVFFSLPGRTNVLQHNIWTPPGVVVSPWASSTVMVPKPDGTLRFCNDFRRLNEVSEFDGYPMPRYLGFQVGRGLIRPQEKKVEVVRSAPRPETKTHVRAFLGLAGYYRCFIPNFSSLATSLTDLTRKGQPEKVQWTPAAEEAFQRVKGALISEPILRAPDFSCPFLLEMDASNTGLGAVLSQIREGEEHPVIYISRKLIPAERNYAAVEKEALAVKWALLELRYYLLGRKFPLVTNHAPLQVLSDEERTASLVFISPQSLNNY
ncbi:uncharacterized protein [Sinocyclocheilus grahami]|uniref:uncharacterized protein n=1 Tax=Sinocyclocheilus grahami TaxID=75366 RepID=UPI0007AD15CE|nr:PREDICTED: uncharacterized protein LOC107563058 [Sinocyclocheilus grahami]